ncbi:hypothetical protein K503DRAFT_870941 [Rhizopogon vinicolor AM-OR11-026]|uniref:Uncharacterized protein n=1 Tax=Rhizopogon vinicolor AM-OR11-026 TaxID=1314800 RepID=A0A1B7MDG5_9AGAM|nr:hypothetical protein K503DRAFT_870941 [Rhizopogon vinicolor AM-OR11-026]
MKTSPVGELVMSRVHPRKLAAASSCRVSCPAGEEDLIKGGDNSPPVTPHPTVACHADACNADACGAASRRLTTPQLQVHLNASPVGSYNLGILGSLRCVVFTPNSLGFAAHLGSFSHRSGPLSAQKTIKSLHSMQTFSHSMFRARVPLKVFGTTQCPQCATRRKHLVEMAQLRSWVKL